MHSISLKRQPRLVLAVAASAAAIAAGVLGASPANAATTASLSLTPSSGTNFTTDAASLGWSLPAACAGQEVDVFLYQGTGAWNSAAINQAEGNNGAQSTYYNFLSETSGTATGSTSWPNVASGYQLFGTGSGAVFNTTGDLVSSLGTGLYTVSIACVSNTTFTPITDASGNPIATSRVLVLGATGDSWALSSAVGTQVALKGVGTSDSHGIVALSATVTSSNGSAPAGTVNFFANSSATGTPLNSSPVRVIGGKALFVGGSGYPAGVQGAQAYTAQFVPTNAANFTPSSVTSSVNLIAEAVLIQVTAKADPTTPGAVDLTAKAIGTPTSLATLIPGGGVNFVVDGQVFSSSNGGFPAPFAFNSSGVATDVVSGLAAGSHSVTAQLTDSNDDVLTPTTGDEVLANTASVTVVG